jgi:hypothetical protein
MKGSLVEGVDFYMDEGRLVLTAAYHAKRGYCCNSRCRHCPYKDAAEKASPLVITGLSSIKLRR